MREPHSPQNTPESRDRVLQPPTPSSPHYSLIEFDILPGRTTGMATLKGLSAAGACKAATSPIYNAKDASEAAQSAHGKITTRVLWRQHPHRRAPKLLHHQGYSQFKRYVYSSYDLDCCSG